MRGNHAIVTALLAFIALSFGVCPGVSSEEHANANEFKQLCKILRLAEAEPGKVVEEPENLTTSMDGLKKMVKETFVRESLYHAAMARKRESIMGTGDGGGGPMSIHRANVVILWKVTHEKLKRLTERADLLLAAVKEKRRQAHASRKLAKERMAQAIYGRLAGKPISREDFEKFGKHTRNTLIGATASNACGGGHDPNAQESAAGNSLVGDFFCLCVGHKNDKAPCHESIKGPGSGDEWRKVSLDGRVVDFTEGWYGIKNKCDGGSGGDDTEGLVTPPKLKSELKAFNGLLGQQRGEVTGDEKGFGGSARYVLGRAKHTNGVSGSSVNDVCTGDAERTCVDYSSKLLTKKGIEWQLRLLDAEQYLTEMEKYNNETNMLIGRFERLVENAKETEGKLREEKAQNGEEVIEDAGDDDGCAFLGMSSLAAVVMCVSFVYGL